MCTKIRGDNGQTHAGHRFYVARRISANSLQGFLRL
jgi:hypothetical protein